MLTPSFSAFSVRSLAVAASYLSVSFRRVRNRSGLYQQKHRRLGGGLATHQRDPELGTLNIPVEQHYRLCQAEHKGLRGRPVLGFTVSDLTANLLRPHYDALVKPDDPDAVAFHAEETKRVLYPEGSASLFYLEDEPIGKVAYTLLVCYESGSRTRFGIIHDVAIESDGRLPPGEVSEEMRHGLKWWAACPPILVNGECDLLRFSLLQYDLRPVFGHPTDPADEAALQAIYDTFPCWEDRRRIIETKLDHFTPTQRWYHGVLGLRSAPLDEIVLVHQYATVVELSETLKQLGIRDAVLLDSGGSPAVYLSWLNGNQGGIVANSWYYRPTRGAVAFLVLNEQHFRPTQSLHGAEVMIA